MAQRKLHVSDSLSLPLELGSQAAAIFGIRGSGKTNTAGVLAEELLKADQPIAVVDPTDAWWGLRSSRDGKRDGFPVFIFGGTHADLPLEETDGKVIAEFLVQERVPVVLSLRHLRKGAQRRFVTELCEELYHLKGRPEYRSPLTVFIDEAPLFIPQKVIGEMARTVGAVEDLVARGRNAGFGVCLVSQRPATLNADVRSLCDTIITHRVTGPLDRKAFSLWIEENASLEQQDEVLASLATLKNGEAWVWSPALGVMKRVQMRLRDSFDSSATPKAGHAAAPPKKLAEIDKEKLKGRLSAAVEKAKADDPKELKKQVAELQRQLAKGKAAAAPAAPKVETKRVEVEVLKEGQLKKVDSMVGRLMEAYSKAEQILKETKAAVDVVAAAVARTAAPAPAVHVTGGAARVAPAAPPRAAARPARDAAPPAAAGTARDYDAREQLDKPMRRIVDAYAWWHSIGVDRPSRENIAPIAGYSNIRSSGFRNPLYSCQASGLVADDALTDRGRQLAEWPEQVTSLDAYHQKLKAVVDGPAANLFDALHKLGGTTTREGLAGAAGYTHVRSSGFRNPLYRLSSMGLVALGKGESVAATELMYPPTLS